MWDTKEFKCTTIYYWHKVKHILSNKFNKYSCKKLTLRISIKFTFSDITLYNVLFRFFAFASMCYSLLPIMLKIFDVICQLADDFYEKNKTKQNKTKQNKTKQNKTTTTTKKKKKKKKKQQHFFPHLSRILPLQVRQTETFPTLFPTLFKFSGLQHANNKRVRLNVQQTISLLLLTICKWQFSVSGQILFNRADKNKSTVGVLCLMFSAMLYYMSDIKVPDNSH